MCYSDLDKVDLLSDKLQQFSMNNSSSDSDMLSEEQDIDTLIHSAELTRKEFLGE